jgi:hypothetical protein
MEVFGKLEQIIEETCMTDHGDQTVIDYLLDLTHTNLIWGRVFIPKLA